MVALLACGGQVSPIGGGPSAGSPGVAGLHAGGSGNAGSPPVAAGAYHVATAGTGSTSAEALTVPAQLAGTWTGYVEGHKFGPDGSSQVVVVLSSDGSSTSQVRFGDSPLIAPATDPELGYPTEYEYSPQGGYPSQSVTARGPVPGFEFTARAGSVEASRLQFDVLLSEVWTHWCELQRPVEVQSGSYNCVPDWGFLMLGSSCAQINPQTQQFVIINCAKLDLCDTVRICACTAQGCSLAPGSTVGAAHFDLNVDGDKADGSVVGLPDGHNVHLTKN